MKRILIIVGLAISLQLSAQIDTSPGGGPNGYKEMKGDCANLDPLVRILENSFIQDFKKKNINFKEDNFFSLLEEISIYQSVKSVSTSSQLGIVKLSCHQDDVEDLKKIRDMYQAATIGDEKCLKYLKDFHRLELLERVIKLNEKN